MIIYSMLSPNHIPLIILFFTSGFHFTEGLLAALQAKGVQVADVTLHVGLGTFMPLHTEKVGLSRVYFVQE